jgi:hypothetical protein
MRKPMELVVSRILHLSMRLMETMGTLFWYERRLSDAATAQKETRKTRAKCFPPNSGIKC